MRSRVEGAGAHRSGIPGGQPPADGVVDGERSRCHELAAPAGWRRAGALAGRGAVGRRRHGAVALGDAALAAALEHGMGGDALAVLQDVDLGRGDLDLDGAASGAVGHGVEIAADRDHALARDPALQARARR